MFLSLVNTRKKLAQFNAHVNLVRESEAFRNYIKYSLQNNQKLNPMDAPAYRIVERVLAAEAAQAEALAEKLKAGHK